MRRLGTLVHFLILWLLVMAFHNGTNSKVYTSESADSELRPQTYSSRQTAAYIQANWEDEKRKNKQPSGPNPNGNHLPPTRT